MVLAESQKVLVEGSRTYPFYRGEFKCFPGKVAVLMSVPCLSVGQIALPDEVSEQMRSDVGKVVGVGEGVDDLHLGDEVCVRYRAGMDVEDLEIGDYYSPGETRLYGCAGGGSWDDPFLGSIVRPARVAYWECVLFKMDLKAVGRNVILELDELKDTEGSIFLPDSAVYREPVCKVVSVGSLCKDVKVGMRVVVHQGAGRYFRYKGRDYVCIPEGSDYIYGHA